MNAYDGMIGYFRQPGMGSEMNVGWYDKRAPESYRRLQTYQLGKQMLEISRRKWEQAKRAQQKGPAYSSVSEAAEMAARYPFSLMNANSTNPMAQKAYQINRERMERIGLMARSTNEPNSIWRDILEKISRGDK